VQRDHATGVIPTRTEGAAGRSGDPGPRRRSALAPAVAGALAIGYLAFAVALPSGLLVVAAIATVSACGLGLGRRKSTRFSLTLSVLTVWLAVGLGGAALLADRPLGGPAWLLVVLFLLPLPVIPWLYAWTFDRRSAEQKGGDEP
jgi:hypothetical protein